MARGVVSRYGPGELPSSTQPGDFILTHRRENYGRLVRLGQRLRFTGPRRQFAHWSHSALVTGSRGELIEATDRGVVRTHLNDYRGVEFHYIDTRMDWRDRMQSVRFAESCLEHRYAWVSIAAIIIVLLTNTRFEFGLERTQFCSELVSRALERGPFIFPKSPGMMMPAHLAEFFHVTAG